MANIDQTEDEVRLNLLDRCFNLGLPASSKDDINTLEMYLAADSKLDVESFKFPEEINLQRGNGIKFRILKKFLIYKS